MAEHFDVNIERDDFMKLMPRVVPVTQAQAKSEYRAWLKKVTDTPPKGESMPNPKKLVPGLIATVNLDLFTQNAPGVLVAEASMLRWPAGRWPRMFLLEGLADGPQMAVYKQLEHNGLVHVYKTLNWELHIIND